MSRGSARRLGALILLGLAVGSAGAEIVPYVGVAQNRAISVQAVANGPFSSDSYSDADHAVDYDRFNSGRSVLALADPAASLASASQDSDIRPNCVVGSGEVVTFAGGEPGSDGFAIASSVLSFTFDLLEAAPVELIGQLHSAEDIPPLGPSGVISLLGPGGYLVNENVNQARPDASINWHADLPAGRYTLLASVASDAVYNEFFGQNSGSASFTLRFCVIPEPATGALALLLAFIRRRA